MKMSVFPMIIIFLTLSGLGLKFSRMGKDPPGGHKLDSKLCRVQLLTSSSFAVFLLVLQEFYNNDQYENSATNMTV